MCHLARRAVVAVALAGCVGGCAARAGDAAAQKAAPASAPATAGTPDLLKNGDFRQGKDGWAIARAADEKNATWDEDAGEGRGTCFKAAVTAVSQKLQQEVASPLLDDRLYELSADVKCDADNTDVGLAVMHGYGVTRGFTSGKAFPAGRWTRLSMRAMVRNDKDDGGRRNSVIVEWSDRALGDKKANVYVDNVQLKEIGRVAAGQAAGDGENLLSNGDFESGLDHWGKARMGGFEISDQGFRGRAAVLKADKTDIRGADQMAVVPNEDALYRLRFKMRPRNTEGGKYFIGVMFIFCDLKNRPCGYYFLPLPSKTEGAWLDKTCYFYAEHLAGAAGAGAPPAEMKVKISFYANPAREDTRMEYDFDDISLVRMEKALAP